MTNEAEDRITQLEQRYCRLHRGEDPYRPHQNPALSSPAKNVSTSNEFSEIPHSTKKEERARTDNRGRRILSDCRCWLDVGNLISKNGEGSVCIAA